MKELTVNIDGNPYRLTALDARQFQEFLDFAKASMPNPVDAVLETAARLLDGPVKDRFLDKHLDEAFNAVKLRGTLADPDLDEFIRSAPGHTKLFSLMFRKHHPHLTADECVDLVVKGIEEHGPELFQDLHRDGTKVPMTEDAVEARYFRKRRTRPASK